MITKKKKNRCLKFKKKESCKVLLKCLHATGAFILFKLISLFQSNPFQMALFTSTDSNPLSFVIQEKLFQLLVNFGTNNARGDIKATSTSWNLPVLKLHWCLPANFHHEILKRKKKFTGPLYDQVLPLLPKTGLFFSLEQLRSFLSASLNSNNRHSVPWDRRGGTTQWEEGHTSHSMHKRQAGGKRKRTQTGENSSSRDRERKKSLCLKGAF